jgi:transcriptional regulator NrdR family protein
MQCPNCKSGDVVVRDSRVVAGERQRRRKCRACNAVWFTRETIVEGSLDVARLEPVWWGVARSLRRKGMTLIGIARELDRSQHAVRRALMPSVRRQHADYQREYLGGDEARRVRRITRKDTHEARA